MDHASDKSSLSHLAIIMDGNGRWAKKRHKLRVQGHRKGVQTATDIVGFAQQKGIKTLSLFAFSSENWGRPKDEVSALMEIFYKSLNEHIEKLHEKNIRVRFIGDRNGFSENLQKAMQNAESLTINNDSMTLLVAANYGGQWDITQAAISLGKDIEKGILKPSDITIESFGQQLSFSDIQAPDLLIRTSGEQRISNFYLWQMAYTELYFSETYWPDFNEAELDKAIDWYQSRDRRYGKTKALKENQHAT